MNSSSKICDDCESHQRHEQNVEHQYWVQHPDSPLNKKPKGTGMNFDTIINKHFPELSEDQKSSLNVLLNEVYSDGHKDALDSVKKMIDEPLPPF